MTPTTQLGWQEANKAYLVRAMAPIREAIAAAGVSSRRGAQGHEARQDETRTAAGAPREDGARQDATRESGARQEAARKRTDEALAAMAAAMPAPPTLETLCDLFGLSGFERDVLLLCAGVELDRELAATLAPGGPTFSLALAALPRPHWSALSPTGPLRRWRLIEIDRPEGLTTAPLRIDERVLHFLVGVDCLDERLFGFLDPLPAPADGRLPPSHAGAAGRLAGWWSRPGPEGWPVVALGGADHAAKIGVAAAACAELGLTVGRIRAGDLPTSPADRDGLVLLAQREAALGGMALLIDGQGLDAGASHPGVVEAFVEATGCRLAVALSDSPMTLARPLRRLEIDLPARKEQRELWRRALGDAASIVDGAVDRVVAQYRLDTRSIEDAAGDVLAMVQGGELPAPANGDPAPADGDAAPAGGRAARRGGDPGPADGDAAPAGGKAARRDGDAGPADGSHAPGSTLWRICRRRTRGRLEELAQRLTPCARWESLVLPDSQVEVLREIATHMRQRTRVYEQWGFAAASDRGLGISTLFAGPSGTGKTMAAEVLANELELDLYRIDLSQVVSKYIGETEKNLRRVFDAAETAGALLLFDEADALFGKRSEVRDSHDRYANIEVSYLLQRMEAYRGVSVLTTNLREAIDKAFLRRIRFIVQFPFPDAALRARIWAGIFPPETPTEGLDLERLAQLNVPGGGIRNIAMNAAFLAAERDGAVGPEDILRAARHEYAKADKTISDTERRGWA